MFIDFNILIFTLLIWLIEPIISSETNQWNYEKCGVPHNKVHFRKRIVGGEPAALHSWPWQVRLLRYFSNTDKKSLKDTCGGTIISEDYVITAAHCVLNKYRNETESPSKLLVIAGDHDRSSDWDGETQNITVGQIHVHPDYSSKSSFNDIALLKLAQSLKFNENISKCCVSSVSTTENEFCFATGWGETQKVSEPKDFLRQVNLPILSTKKCRSRYFGDKIGNGMLCAGFEDGGKDTCQGDSGGPLVCKRNGVWFLVGVTSWGVECAKSNSPGVYTKVSSYVQWIESIVERYKIIEK